MGRSFIQGCVGVQADTASDGKVETNARPQHGLDEGNVSGVFGEVLAPTASEGTVETNVLGLRRSSRVVERTAAS
jgi:hypothetical protein